MLHPAWKSISLLPVWVPTVAGEDSTRHSRENLDLDANHIRACSIHDDEDVTSYDVLAVDRTNQQHRGLRIRQRPPIVIMGWLVLRFR